VAHRLAMKNCLFVATRTQPRPANLAPPAKEKTAMLHSASKSAHQEGMNEMKIFPKASTFCVENSLTKEN